MARVVVVGGGFAGLSAAARLAKLHHDVTLLDAADRLGGGLHGIEIDGARWPLHPELVTLPGVFRDLFRKSGRPMDRTLGLEPAPGRRHVFADGEVLDLPMGRRADQHDAVTAAFGQDDWSTWVDGQDQVWEVLRRHSLDVVLTGPDAFDRDARRVLRPRRPVGKLAARDLADARLAKVILDPIRLDGLDRRSTPGFLAVSHYVERTFGRWRFEGGWPGLAAALEQRLVERKVTVETGQHVHRVVLDGPDGGVTAVETADGRWPADVVVWCNRTVPDGLDAPRDMPVVPASRTFLELAEDPPELAVETLVHANPPIRVHSSGDRRWTLAHRSGENVLVALARFGLDLRELVVVRHDLKPIDLVPLGHEGWTWTGWSSMFDRPGVGPARGVYHAGSHAHPGPRLEQIGMATAAVAAHIGAAPR